MRAPQDQPRVHRAIARIEADYVRPADRHLLAVPLPALAHIVLFLKDGSIKPGLIESIGHARAKASWVSAE